MFASLFLRTVETAILSFYVRLWSMRNVNMHEASSDFCDAI